MWVAVSKAEAGRCAGPRQGLPAAVLAVVDERAHRREPEAALVGRLGALLLRMGPDQRHVQIDDDLAAVAAAGLPVQRSAPVPGAGPSLRPSGPDGRQRDIDVAGQGGDQS